MEMLHRDLRRSYASCAFADQNTDYCAAQNTARRIKTKVEG